MIFRYKMREDLLIYSTVENNLETEAPEPHYITTIQQKIKLVTKANDALTADIVYAFVRKFQVESSPELTADGYKHLPYGGKLLKKGLRWDLAQMPPKLVCMLYTFLTKYYSQEAE